MSDSDLPSAILGREFDLTGVELENFDAKTTADELHGHGMLVGGLGLILETDRQVCEVFDDLQLCRLPNTAAWLSGIANQRGSMVPIFDIEALLGFNRDKSQKSKQNYMIYGKKEDAVGMLIDDMPNRVVFVAEERLSSMPPLPAVLQPFVQECYEQDGKIWIRWDIFAFFDAMRDRVAA